MQKTANGYGASVCAAHGRPVARRLLTSIMSAVLPRAVAGRRAHSKVFVLAMRLTFILLTAAFLNLHAEAVSQTVTLSGKNIPLGQVFSAVKKQTGFVVFGNSTLFSNARPVSLQAQNMPLRNFLDLVFERQPLTYHIDGKTIFVAARPVRENPASTAADPGEGAQAPSAAEVSGMVLNADMDPLANASVIVKRTGKGTLTDGGGKFSLKGIDPNDVLVVSYLGYTTGEYPLSGQKEIMVIMQVADNQLDQVIVQGYGKTTRRSATGNIAKVSAEDIGRQNNMNPMIALQGRVPGLSVTPIGGGAAGRVRIELRGRKSINNGFTSDPLYIIDGVPLTLMERTGSYEGGSGGVMQGDVGTSNGGQSPFFNINPNDIESIEVLKDADATAIYGSRGANGVILVTTKKAKVAGQSVFDVNISQGINIIDRYWDLLDTKEYLALRREALANDGLIANPATAPDLTVWDTTRYTDWQKDMWGKTGKITKAMLSLSSGGYNTQFRLSGAYERQEEILSTSGSNERISLATNIGHSSISKKFRMQFSNNYSWSKVDTRPTVPAFTIAPNAPAIYGADGKLNYKEWNDAGIGSNFPFQTLEAPASSGTHLLTSSLNLHYELLPGLSISSNIGFNNIQNSVQSLLPLAAQNPLSFPMGWHSSGSNNITNWIVEPQVNYHHNIWKGKLSLLAGATYQYNTTKANTYVGYGYASDDFIESIQLAPYHLVTAYYGQYKYAALFGRATYNLMDRYFLNVNVRRDGSSRFGPSNRYGNFGSVGASWIASEEAFVKSWMPEAISLLKVRGSYGITGSDNVGDYKYLTQWSNTVSNEFMYPYDGIPPLTSQIAVNPNYHWQANRKWEAALSAGFLNDRITLELAYYNERCNNQLTEFPTPIMTGFKSVVANWPANVENSGVEVALNATLIQTQKLRWTAWFNISQNRNTLVSYPGIERSPYAAQYLVGHSLNTRYLLRSLGVDPMTGRYVFEDVTKDGTVNIDASQQPLSGFDDRAVALDLSPEYFGGFGSGLTIGGFDINAAFTFRRQWQTDAVFMADYPGKMNNQPRELLGNYWQKPGDHKKFAALSTKDQGGHNLLRDSDGIYTDVKFLRLTNLTAGYSLPDSWTKAARLKGCRFFVQAQNVFVITNYKGLDPESYAFGMMPPAKAFTGGVSIQL
ncbi:SusC/RagA family TonB-linked outer membrane protein [Chitinophaga rhizosphaerae]|uniref:SusC/RagA family TonB-linked outer membrane protein n=1 Tax=Chitinophaga rhizosphaerae TaxID=1864947 RepID=UPI0013DFAC87|nr:SusC/RagA family TonB-linked outer membrane protein [Chitinophaga rhizosphaerae]